MDPHRLDPADAPVSFHRPHNAQAGDSKGGRRIGEEEEKERRYSDAHAKKASEVPLLISLALFTLGMLVGIVVTSLGDRTPPEHLYMLIKYTGIYSKKEKIVLLDILFNNIYSIGLEIIGFSTFGLLTLEQLLLNGYLLGMILYLMARSSCPALAMLLVVPHATIEIPATIVAGAAGFTIPYDILMNIKNKEDHILTRESITRFLYLAVISIALISLAAIIEAYITPRIATMIPLRC